MVFREELFSESSKFLRRRVHQQRDGVPLTLIIIISITSFWRKMVIPFQILDYLLKFSRILLGLPTVLNCSQLQMDTPSTKNHFRCQLCFSVQSGSTFHYIRKLYGYCLARNLRDTHTHIKGN